MTYQAQAVAAAFVAARKSARALEEYPGERPVDLVDAYRIQDHAILLHDRQIAGWKVGRINSPDAERLGANRLAGPIFADSVVYASDGDKPAMPVFAGGFAAAEAEFLLHVAAGWDGVAPSDNAAARALIDDVRLGIEIASSPYPGINADGPSVTTSDFGNNAGLVIGPQLATWQELDLADIEVVTVIDGCEIGRASVATMLDGPFGAVRFLLGNLAERGIGSAGDFWISTGAVTGVHTVEVGQTVTAVFGNFGEVHSRIVAAAG